MRRVPWVVTLFTLLLATGWARADGGFFYYGATNLARSGDQRAIILCDGQRETLIVETGVANPGAGYAWVLPTPTVVEAATIREVDAAVFDQLGDATAPVLTYGGGGGSGLGCGCGMPGDATGGGQPTNAVTVWDTTRVGQYELTTLTATESQALSTWLTDNGYQVPASFDPVLATYVAKGWAFVAIRIAEQTEGDYLSLSPLALTFPAEEPVYPLIISSVSARNTGNLLQLFVIASARLDTASYPCAELDTRPMSGVWGAMDAYAARVRGQCASTASPTFVVEGVRSVWDLRYITDYYLCDLPAYLSGGRLTRFVCYMDAADMTADVTFTEAAEQVPFQPTIQFTEEAAEAQAPQRIALIALAGLSVGALCRGGLRRRGIAGLLGCLLVALML